MRLYYQITVSFVPFILFVCITLGLVQFALMYQSRMDAAHDFLQAIAVLQANRISEGLAMQESVLGSLTSRTKLRRSMAAWNETEDEAARAFVGKIIRDAVQGTRNVEAVHALDPFGHVIASSENRDTGTRYELPALVNNFGHDDLAGLAGIQLPLFNQQPDGGLRQILMGPAVLDNLVVGYLVAEVTPVFISGLEADYSGMGETGETMLGQRGSDGDAVFLSPLRFGEQSRTGDHVLADQLLVPINRALDGQESFFAGAPDYRGEYVIAVTRHIPEHALGVVAKMDRDEVLQPVFRSAGITAISLVIVFFILLLISRMLARSISRPLEELTDKAEEAMKKRQNWKASDIHLNEVSILTMTINKLLEGLYRAEQGLTEERLTARNRKAANPGNAAVSDAGKED